MESRRTLVTGALLAVVVLLVSQVSDGVAGEAKQKPIRGTGEVIAGELSTMAKHLTLNPNSAVDFTHVSGEYCFSANVNQGAHMTHYATDPTSTQEDVIDFVNAESLVKAGAVNVEKLPRFPGTLGSMTPNQWYVLPAGEPDPHHGKSWPYPMLLRASNIK
jgi:hypothetical protein